MKKIFLIVCSICLLLTGCNRNSTEDEALTAYATSYKAVMDNNKWLSTSSYFTLSAEMSSLPDGNYNYYIFIDSPTIALYDVRTIAVENNAPYSESDKMMPTLGIFENAKYSMVPNQINADDGFVKGLVLSGQVDQPTVDIKMMVSWMDATKNTTTREFFAFTITLDGVVYPDDNTETVPTPETTSLPTIAPSSDPQETPIASVEPTSQETIKPTPIIPDQVTYPDYNELSTPLPGDAQPEGDQEEFEG